MRGDLLCSPPVGSANAVTADLSQEQIKRRLVSAASSNEYERAA